MSRFVRVIVGVAFLLKPAVGRADRVPLDLGSRPGKFIGSIIDPSGRSFCSGVKVGPALVFTAEHCVSGGSEGKFGLGFTEGAARSTMPFRSYLDGSSALKKAGFPLEAEHEDADWSLLVNMRTISEFTPFGGIPLLPPEESLSIGEEVSLLGYPSDRSEGQSPTVHRNCHVVAVNAASGISRFHTAAKGSLGFSYVTNCESRPGGSGGALVVKRKVLLNGVSYQRWYLAGITSRVSVLRYPLGESQVTHYLPLTTITGVSSITYSAWVSVSLSQYFLELARPILGQKLSKEQLEGRIERLKIALRSEPFLAEAVDPILNALTLSEAPRSNDIIQALDIFAGAMDSTFAKHVPLKRWGEILFEFERELYSPPIEVITSSDLGLFFDDYFAPLQIDRVEPSGFAAKLGLRRGDVIYKLGQVVWPSLRAFKKLRNDSAGRRHPLLMTIRRDGQEIPIPIGYGVFQN